ncbi:MAG: prepilin peptidase [Gammaproteobacteria bacterium]|nr:prepilin peptidase [Gammaproteobacteria bacterium]
METLTLLAAQPALMVGAMTVLGLLVGSFLNVVIHRLPVMVEREWRSDCRSLLELGDGDSPPEPFDLVRPRSRCPKCGTQITAMENIPLLSYLVLGGRCRHCRVAISKRYPLVEASGGLLGGLAAWHFGFAADADSTLWLLRAFAAACYAWALVALALIDFDTHYLFDNITQPLLWAGLACSFFGLFAPDLGSAVLGAMAGYLSLWSIYWGFKLITGKEGMGYGDFKLLAALGAWLGWQALPAVILLSSVIGAVVGIGAMASGLTKRGEPIPFGPFLAAAGIVAMFFDDAIAGLFQSGARL